VGFDEDAKNWDTERRISRAKIIADEIGNAIGSGRNRTAMEFGCGTVLISFNLRDSFKNITLIDSSKGMIDELKCKIQQYKISNKIY
jgi:predicted TPR repeat methyltransferase